MARRITDYGRKRLQAGNRALPFVSFPLSIGYESLIRARNRLYDSGYARIDRLPVSVVSVGNLTLGGTGKTPTVIMLAGLLKERGYRPAVISRGYGGTSRASATIVSDGVNLLSTAGEAGDEPVLIARSLEGVPVATGRRRFIAGRAVLERFDSDILILDDAFQHRSLYRDVDIVLVDGIRPFGNGRVFPGGLLREPLSSIRRAHMVVVVDGPPRGIPEEIGERAGPYTPLFRAGRHAKDLLDCADGISLPLHSLRGESVAAFAGIAEPERFRATLAPWCGRVEPFLAFPDHHAYNEKDVETIMAASSGRSIVTTEKDGVRLRRHPGFYRQLKLLRIEMRLDPSPDELMSLLRRKIES
ncbi:MAG: tetraacyldisaccharide 4'-kinase [Syntrophales bacterium]|jgi:tetraacyldisaccharide 4'-kinase|nr:tetraacyldisaccharide 4'-kinase [Syntrophales bacterium]MCK9527714.1 tetraacyldisaccharide 4'-kinase [Syntrophales bacterium]MDX9921631.1 tetraacyldisaccharide 4'-kinase [Syntrophales bacterium]